MKVKPRARSQMGISLLEALIALVILSVGILSIAKLNSYLLEVAGSAKARAQATQLAESKLQELRNQIVSASFANVVDGNDTITGYSSSGTAVTAFSRYWCTRNTAASNCSTGTADTDAFGRRIFVAVTWTDRKGTTQTVRLNSKIALDDPSNAAALSLSGSGTAGVYAKAPTGRAFLGDGSNINSLPGGATVKQADPGDGYRIVQGNNDGIYRLVNSSGIVALTATTANEPLAQIVGNVYIVATGSSRINLQKGDVYIVISDASLCSMTPSNSLDNLGSPAKYNYFTYRCYLGANWYGNIAVIRTDNANTNDRVCVGDPSVTSVSSSSKSDNRHPALASSRMYRGYKETSVGSGIYDATGIGMQSGTYVKFDSNGQVAVNGDQGPIYDGHDFVLASISGNPSDADCGAELQKYDSAGPPYDPFGTGGTINDATTHRPTTETAYLYGGNTVTLGNPGKFFCFTSTCPDPLPTTSQTALVIAISGTVDRLPAGTPPSITSITANSGSCTFSVNGSGQYEYTCSVTLAGFTGSSWSGSMTVNTSGFVCANGVSGTASPLPAAPSSNTSASYTFSFTNQSLNITSPTLDFKLGATSGDCP